MKEYRAEIRETPRETIGWHPLNTDEDGTLTRLVIDRGWSPVFGADAAWYKVFDALSAADAYDFVNEEITDVSGISFENLIAYGNISLTLSEVNSPVSNILFGVMGLTDKGNRVLAFHSPNVAERVLKEIKVEHPDTWAIEIPVFRTQNDVTTQEAVDKKQALINRILSTLTPEEANMINIS